MSILIRWINSNVKFTSEYHSLRDLLVHLEQRAALKQISIEKVMDLIHDVLLPNAMSLVGRSGVDVLEIRGATQLYRPKKPGNMKGTTNAAYLIIDTHLDRRWLVYPGIRVIGGARLRNHNTKINVCRKANLTPKKIAGIEYLHHVLTRPGWSYILHIIATFTQNQHQWMPIVETVFMILFKAKCETPTRTIPSKASGSRYIQEQKGPSATIGLLQHLTIKSKSISLARLNAQMRALGFNTLVKDNFCGADEESSHDFHQIFSRTQISSPSVVRQTM